MVELLVVFIIIFIIYGAGWIWQTVNDMLRDSSRGAWVENPGSRTARVLLGGHDLSDLARSWQRFAEGRHGDMHLRQLFQSPKVSFPHQGARVLLSVYEAGESGGPLHTQLTYTIPEGWAYRLEIFPQRRPDDGVSSSVNDVRLGDEAFDGRFIVKTNDEKFAKEFMDGPVRQAVEDLRNLRGNDKILVSLNPSRLLIRKESVIEGVDDLNVLADQAGRLHDRVMVFWQRASGIEILEEPQPEPGSDITCQICGSKIDPAARVVCRRCGTPHHEDCWEFNGRCSTYACGEKRFASKK